MELTRNPEWHIPRSWFHHDGVAAECKADLVHITNAAECALHLALVNEVFIDNSDIPLIAHQTSRSADPSTWSSLVRNCVARWLEAATGCNGFSGVKMAWFMWDDDGVDSLVHEYEPSFVPAFSAVPYPVEKADIFRVLVLKWFGGVVSAYLDDRIARASYATILTLCSTATSIRNH